MTDGVITEGKGIPGAASGADVTALYDYINTLDATWNAVIFTFSLGTPKGSDDLKTVPHNIACQHGGIWVSISDSAEKGALRSAMSGYYSYLANGIVNDKVVWSEEYEDS